MTKLSIEEQIKIIKEVFEKFPDTEDKKRKAKYPEEDEEEE